MDRIAGRPAHADQRLLEGAHRAGPAELYEGPTEQAFGAAAKELRPMQGGAVPLRCDVPLVLPAADARQAER